MNLKIDNKKENLKKKLLGGEKNVIFIIIIILSIILFFIILFTMIKSIKQTPTNHLFPDINLIEPVDKFLQNLSVNTKIDDEIQTYKIINSIKTDKLVPSFFSLAENYYLRIPKSQL